MHARKRLLQILGELIDDSRTPAFPILPQKDLPPDPPIEQHQFAVYAERSANLGLLNPLLQIPQERCVALQVPDLF